MQIPIDILKKWKELRSPEDSGTISDSIGVSSETINRAFRDAKCSDRVFDAMAKHYTSKTKKLKKLVA